MKAEEEGINIHQPANLFWLVKYLGFDKLETKENDIYLPKLILP